MNVYVPVAHKAHQAVIRERAQGDDPRPMANLSEAEVERITTAEARTVIEKYEWLGTIGRAVACYGLRTSDGLLGVACFGWPGAPESRDICGRDLRQLAVCLERGACVHFAPPNAASYLITRSTALAAREMGWRIFYAYADPEAGEIGTVYQASNWLYIGQGVGRTPGRPREYWRRPDGSIVSNRILRHRGWRHADAIAAGWVRVPKHPKHKYIHFEGSRSQVRYLRSRLRYPPLPYPKRSDPVQLAALGDLEVRA